MSLFTDKTAELRQNPDSWALLINEIAKRMLKTRDLLREKTKWIHEHRLAGGQYYNGIEAKDVSEHRAIIKLQNDIMRLSQGQMPNC